MRQDSIRIRGLRQYLEDTRPVHNNRGYTELVKYLTDGDEFGESIPVLKLARAFGVTRLTMEKWLVIFNEERQKDVV